MKPRWVNEKNDILECTRCEVWQGYTNEAVKEMFKKKFYVDHLNCRKGGKHGD